MKHQKEDSIFQQALEEVKPVVQGARDEIKAMAGKGGKGSVEQVKEAIERRVFR